ncbi:MAG TPA: MFS transporter [Jiangellaceae bacterium]
MTETLKRAGRREWTGLAALVLPGLLVAMDLSILFFALPFLSADLEPTATQQLWIMDVYGFMMAGLLITMGTLGDRIGRRTLLMFGAAAFGLASVVAAYSTSPEMLIAARALMGLGGATLAPSTLSLIRNMFHEPSQRRTAIGVWTAGFAGGAFLGPVVGGLMLEHFWWGSAFMLNVPVMVLLLVLAPLLLPEFRDPKVGRFDLVSAVLSLAAVLPVIYGLKRLAEDLQVDPVAVLSVMTGLLMGVVFVRRQRRLADPMIDVTLFGHRSFSVSITATMITSFALMGTSLFSAQYLQLVLGLRPFVAALWTLPGMVTLSIGITAATMLARRTRPAYVVGAGLAIAATGFGTTAQVGGGHDLAVLITGLSVMTLGMGMVSALATDMVMSTAPAQRAGAASALSETANEFGGALGIAVLGSFGVAIYRHLMGDAVPAGVPEAAAEVARETRGGAEAVASGLPGDLGSALLDAADRAFTQGLTTAALAGAVTLVVGSILVAVLLRDVRLVGAAPGEPDAADTAVEPGDASELARAER